MAIKIVEFGVNTGAWSLENAKFGYVLASKEFKRGIHIRTLGNKNIDKIPFEIKEDIIHPTNEDLVGEIRVVSFNTPGNGMVLAQDSATMNLRVTIGALDTGVEEDLIVVIMKPGIKLVRYDSNADICSTFKYMRDTNPVQFYGCMIRMVPEAGKIALRAQGRLDDKFVHCQVSVNEEGYQYIANICESKNLIANIQKEEKKLHGRTRFFLLNDQGIRTNLVITKEKYLDELGKIIDEHSSIPDAETIRVITLNEKSTNKHLLQRDERQISEIVNGNRPKIRAFSVYKVEVPFQFVKDLGVLFTFKIEQTGKVKCTKSL